MTKIRPGIRLQRLAGVFRWFVLLLAAIILLPGAAWFGDSAVRAQVTASNLRGVVMDKTGAVVVNVKITVFSPTNGLERQAATNDSGQFFIPLLLAGVYKLTAEMAGFATVTVDDVVLQASIDSSIEIVLSPKPISETLEVQAGTGIELASKIDIGGGTTRYSVDNKQVTGLPILTTTLGRNGLEVLPFLVPGVVPTTLFISQLSEVNRHGGQMTTNGGRPSTTSFNLDGGSNDDLDTNGAAAPLPNPDALQEMTIVTGNYRADLGRSSGGVLNAVTRSGTNAYHGNLRSFVINEALNARGFFDPRTPLDRVNTFGGQIGGPIEIPRVYDGTGRTFFFTDYEGTRSTRESLSSRIVLSPAERKGDFSNLPPSQWPIDPLTQTPFPGGIIPAGRVNPISRTYLDKYIPLPNIGDRRLDRLLPTDFSDDELTARFDHRLRSRDALSATCFVVVSTASEGVDYLPVGSQVYGRSENRNFVVRETHVFSAGTVNELTGAVITLGTDSQLRSTAAGASPGSLGFTGFHAQSSASLGAPSISINGTDVYLQTGNDSTATKTTWQLKDDLSHTVGRQVIRAGFETRRFTETWSEAGSNGAFSFIGLTSPAGTGSAIGDFLMGLPFDFFEFSGRKQKPRGNSYYLYAVDAWRMKPNLTLDIGLRYELAPGVVDALDQVAVFRPGRKSERFPGAPAGYLFGGDPDPILGSVPRAGYRTDKKNLAPRVGIAFSPRPHSAGLGHFLGRDRTSVRAGWGIFYDQTSGGSFTQLTLNEPFSTQQHIFAGEMAAAGGTFANPFGRLPNPWPLDPSRPLFISQPSLYTFDPRFRRAYVYQYNVTIQRELPRAILLEVAYAGNDSFRLNRQRELNPAVVGRGASIFNVYSRRTYPQLGPVISQESTGRARYDSFRIRVARQRARKLNFDMSYTYGKSLDNGSLPYIASLTDPLRWARSDFDRRHVLAASYTYDFPASRFHGIAGLFLDGWQTAGIIQLYSGSPFDISQPLDSTLTASVLSGLGSPDLIAPYRRLDPRSSQTIFVNGVAQTGNFFFDPRSFREVPLADARPGNLGRNVFDGPGAYLCSLALGKQFKLSESRRLTLRSDIRNVFNHANFQLSQSSIGSQADFGMVSRAAPGRTVQISLRFTF